MFIIESGQNGFENTCQIVVTSHFQASFTVINQATDKVISSNSTKAFLHILRHANRNNNVKI